MGSIHTLGANPFIQGAQQVGSRSPLLSSLTRPKSQTRGTSEANARSLSADSKAKRFITVHAEDRLTVPVTLDSDPGATLSAYMQLPVSQFLLMEVPLGAELCRLGVDLFELLVPRLSLFGIWLQPRVKCIVTSNSGTVNVHSVSLVIEGSDIVQRLRLNDRVDFGVRCQIMHDDGAQPLLHCASEIHALVEPPPPFAIIPDKVLAGAASSVMTASLSMLQRTFLPSLAADYAKWATSKTYREQRAQHAVRSDELVCKQ